MPISPILKPGERYCIHKVTLNDTLDGIAIKYDMSKELIRKANEFSGDEIYMFKTLVIPYRSKIE